METFKRTHFALIRSPYVIPGRPDHIDYLIGRLRRCDCEELRSMTGEDPDACLDRCWRNSGQRWSIVYRGEIIGVFGLHAMSLMGNVGVPWMLGREELSRIGKSLVTEGRKFLLYMLQIYPRLVNYVDARNTASIRWLDRLGFQILPAAPMGVEQRPFHKFEIVTGELDYD